MDEAYQRFFSFMQQEHNLTLLKGEMDDIVHEALKLNEEIQIQDYNDNMAAAIDAGGGCSRCGDLSGFECICDDWDEYCCEICHAGGDCSDPLDVIDWKNRLADFL